MTQAIPVSALSDNYIWIIPLGGDSRRAVVVDPGDAPPALAALRELGLEAAAVLLTHHHPDHCGGVAELVARHGVPVYGPAGSPARGIDHAVRDGDDIDLEGRLRLRVIGTPGHTLDHVSYAGPGLLLCGDTLFAAGCGRLFEGTAAQMLASLKKLAALPPVTAVCCGHEYTLANLAFAAQVEPANVAVTERLERVRRLRQRLLPSLPSTLADELDTNPFLRCREAAVVRAAERAAGRALASESEVFAALRRLKDNFR